MLEFLISTIEPTGCFPDARTADGRSFDGRPATRTTTMTTPDKFADIGLFSRGSIGMSEVTKPAEYKKQVKVVSFGNGRTDGGAAASKPSAEDLKSDGIDAVVMNLLAP
jgi:hypothetical protein